MITLIQLLALYLSTSLLEWFIHRYLMHRPTFLNWVYQEHGIVHHRIHFPTCDVSPDETDESRTNLRFGWGTLWAFVGLVSPLSAFAVVGGWINGIIPALWAVLIWWVWSEIHDEMHFPKNRWFARSRLFDFWHRWHCEHHRRQSKNFGIVCIGADYLLGTASNPKSSSNGK